MSDTTQKEKMEITPIEFTLKLKTRPSKIFKVLISQNDLRKWWAPHVAMSHSKISQEKNKFVKMQLTQNTTNQLLRYSWRPEAWEADQPNGSITFKITDLSLSREANDDEGIILDIVHDGWQDEDEKNRQQQIWELALKSLRSLIEEDKVELWWNQNIQSENWDQVKIQVIKKFIDEGRKSNQNYKAQVVKIIYQKLWKICNNLDQEGKWFINNEKSDIMFIYQNVKIFRANFEEIFLLWDEIKSSISNYLNNLKERLSVEQDININLIESETLLKIQNLQTELWLEWLTDLLNEISKFKKKKLF